MKRIAKAILAACLAAMLSSCPPIGSDLALRDKIVKIVEKPVPVTSFEIFARDVVTAISRFNGKAIYSMLAAHPAVKPESDSVPTTTYSCSLASTAAAARSVSRSMELPEREADSFASGVRQLGRAATGSRAAPASPVSVGTTWNGVKIASTGNSINTTCRYVSASAYFFVDNRDTSAMNGYLPGYAASFDAIASTNHAHFGTEYDIDANGKIIVLFTEELPGTNPGYFYLHDEYSTSTYADSNHGEIIYLTADSSSQGTTINRTFAHEFQHMIYFAEHNRLGVNTIFKWLNEALSQAAEYYNGCTDIQLTRMAGFLNAGYGGLSLTQWTESENNYGYMALYMRYLIDRFGDATIKNMCSTFYVGVAAVENATLMDFNALYDDFTRALVMSGTGDSTDPRYGYKTLDLRAIQPTGRGGLVPTSAHIAGDAPVACSLYAYRIFFIDWTGAFGTMTLSEPNSGTNFAGTVFGLSR
jgi:hypothetical protein